MDGGDANVVVIARTAGLLLAEGAAPGEVVTRLVTGGSSWRPAVLGVCLALGIPQAEAQRRLDNDGRSLDEEPGTGPPLTHDAIRRGRFTQALIQLAYPRKLSRRRRDFDHWAHVVAAADLIGDLDDGDYLAAVRRCRDQRDRRS